MRLPKKERKQRFTVGQRAIIRATGAGGTIVTVINENDPEDIRQQGYRYEVLSHGHIWSILQTGLIRH